MQDTAYLQWMFFKPDTHKLKVIPIVAEYIFCFEGENV